MASHAPFNRVFSPGRLTFGLITPLEAYPATPLPTLKDHARMAQLVDDAGFTSLWLRDVAFLDPQFGDAGQMLDPFVYAGYPDRHDYVNKKSERPHAGPLGKREWRLN